MKKILFISHEASTTGAPFVLLYFMEWLKEHHSNAFEVGILHLKGGELSGRLNSFANNHFDLSSTQINKNQSLSNKILSFLYKPLKKRIRDKVIHQIIKEQYDIIYANTIVSLEVASALKTKSKYRLFLIAHIHELNVVLRTYSASANQLKSVDHIIAVSKLVKENLIKEWKISDKIISVVYEFSRVNLPGSKTKPSKNTFTVGASGQVHWRKGQDVFIQVARYIKSNYPDFKIEFNWIGYVPVHEKLILEEDLRKLGLNESVHFLGQKKEPYPYYQDFDVFLLTSREDPFPLVCIEVGMLGKPIICFENATGTQEVIEQGGGKIVPYLNVEKMSDAIVAYYNNPKRLFEDGQLAINIFSEFSPKNQAPKIFEIINKFDIN